MKVLYVIDSLGGGGSERSLAELLPHLAERGVEARVICFHRRRGVAGDIRAAGIDVEILEATGLARIRAVRRRIRGLRPDLIHTTLFQANMAGRLAGIGLSIPLLTSLVSTSYAPWRLRDPNIQPHKLRIVQKVDGWTGRHLSGHFHAVSETVRDAAIRDLRLPPERITVIERGRDPVRLGAPSPERRRAARDRLDLHARAPVLVTVGRQEFAKGQRYLLEAAAALVPDHPEATLLVVGARGQCSAELHELAAAPALVNRVRFLGRRDDVPNILAAADVFVLPSLFEGFPGAAVEAMALGLPVVGSDLGALREVVGPAGTEWLVEPGNAEALAAALRDVLDRPDAARAAGERNRARFLAELTIERCAERMLALYRGLDSGARR